MANEPDSDVQPSPPTPPAQWNLHGWMSSYQAAQRSTSPVPVVVQPPKEELTSEVRVEDKMMGGWKFEGKEKPVTPRICPKCQWQRSNPQQSEPDSSDWCENCIQGQPSPGSDPDKSYRPPEPKSKEVTSKNWLFG